MNTRIPFLLIVSLGVGSVLRSAFGRVGGSLVTGMVVTGLAWLVVGSLLLAIFAGIAAMFVTLIGASIQISSFRGQLPMFTRPSNRRREPFRFAWSCRIHMDFSSPACLRRSNCP